MKAIPAETLQEIVTLANNLRAAQEVVARLSTELWKRCLVLRSVEGPPELEAPPHVREPAEETEGLIDLDHEVIKNVLRATKAPPPPDAPKSDQPRISGKDKHAAVDSDTNKIMMAIDSAGRALRTDEIHTLIGKAGPLNNTQAIVSQMKNTGFLSKDDRQRPALWSLAARGTDRVRRIKEQNNG